MLYDMIKFTHKYTHTETERDKEREREREIFTFIERRRDSYAL